MFENEYVGEIQPIRFCVYMPLCGGCGWYEIYPNWYGFDYKSVTFSVTLRKNVTDLEEIKHKNN